LLLICGLHSAALLLLFYINLHFLLLLLFGGLLGLSLRQSIISGISFTHGLSLQLGEPLLFQNDDSPDWQQVDVIESFVSRWLIVIKIETLLDSKQHALVYAVDSISHLSFRRLVVYINNLSLQT
jgi:hypothetical protein